MFNNNEFEFIENVLLSVNIKEEKFDDQDNIKDDIICYIKNSRRTVQLRRLKYTVIYTSVACLFALVFTVASYNNSWVECIAHKGKHIANLPCGTVVSINSGSIIRFNKLDWLFYREIELNGEAQFDVTKGKKFTVNTKQGSIK